MQQNQRAAHAAKFLSHHIHTPEHLGREAGYVFALYLSWMLDELQIPFTIRAAYLSDGENTSHLAALTSMNSARSVDRFFVVLQSDVYLDDHGNFLERTDRQQITGSLIVARKLLSMAVKNITINPVVDRVVLHYVETLKKELTQYLFGIQLTEGMGIPLGVPVSL